MKRKLLQLSVVVLAGLAVLALGSFDAFAVGVLDPMDRPATMSKNPERSVLLAVTTAGNRLVKEAIGSLEKVLEHFQKEDFNHYLIPEGYLFLARTSFEMEEYDRCIRYLAMASSLAGGNPLHNFQIGIIYQRMGRHREALEVFREVSGKAYIPSLFPAQPLPNPSELLLHMAYSLYCMNDLQNALKLINASAPKGQEIGKSWELLGTKAFVLENMGLAVVAFETALRFGPLEPASWERLGAAYKLRGLSEKAKECFMRAEGREPSSPRGYSRVETV